MLGSSVRCAIVRRARTRSRWSSRAGPSVLGLLAAFAAAVPATAAAQDDDADRACLAFGAPTTVAECRLSVGAARLVQPRFASALFGGSAVPGTASTLGMRIGSLPRMSFAFRVTGAPTEIPPIEDRSDPASDRALLVGFTADGALGLLPGFSPLPTVGGVLSVDLIGRLGYIPLSSGAGFHDAGVFGWAVGARVGALRESFTLPGISLTGTYGRIGRTAVGDPSGAADDGHFEGAVNDLRAAISATKRVGLVGLTGGVAWDRFSSDLDVGFRSGPGGIPMIASGDAVHERWSAHGAASWTLLIFHAAAEVGWQETPELGGLPADVQVDPTGWFGGIAFRVSI